MVAQEAHDQLRADAEVVERIALGALQAVDDGLERDAAVSVRLWVEEQLDVDETLGCDPSEVGHRKVVEVVFRPEDGHALVVLRQERGEVPEIVGCPHLGDRCVRQLEPIAPCQLELQLRLQRALDVQVQLGLGDRSDERLDVHVG